VLACAVLAGQVGWAVQPVRRCRAEQRRCESTGDGGGGWPRPCPWHACRAQVSWSRGRMTRSRTVR